MFFLHNVERRGVGSNLCVKILAGIIYIDSIIDHEMAQKSVSCLCKERAGVKGLFNN